MEILGSQSHGLVFPQVLGWRLSCRRGLQLDSIRKALNWAWRRLDLDPGTVVSWLARAGQRALLVVNPLLLSLKVRRFSGMFSWSLLIHKLSGTLWKDLVRSLWLRMSNRFTTGVLWSAGVCSCPPGPTYLTLAYVLLYVYSLSIVSPAVSVSVSVSLFPSLPRDGLTPSLSLPFHPL